MREIEAEYKYIDMVTTEDGTFPYDKLVTAQVIRARKLARQARFEHGEKPALGRGLHA